MSGAVLERLGRSSATDPFNWITRAKIQSQMNEHYHLCKETVVQHLEAYYGDRQDSVFMRAGVTARVTVELLESQASKLMGMLVDSIKPPLRNARSFQMVAESMNGFISYLDMTMNRIGPRIDLEMRNFPKSEHYSQSTGEIWAESRARVVEKLEVRRAQFGFAAKPAAVIDEPLEHETASYPPEPQADAPLDPETAHLPPQPAFEEPLTLDPGTILPEPAFVAQEAFETDTWLQQPEPEAQAPMSFEPAPVLTEPEPEAIPALVHEAGEPERLAQHWQEMWSDIAVQLCTGRLQPGARGDLGRAMSNWFADRDIEGTETEVNECDRRFWQNFVATQRVTSCLDQDAIERAMEMHEFTLNKTAWQSGLLRSSGLAAGGDAIFRHEEFSCSPGFSPLATEFGHFGASEPADDEPSSANMRYRVSWSTGPESRLTAPGFAID